jgi:hypothetical protein
MALKNVGISPNLLVKDVRVTAPWIFDSKNFSTSEGLPHFIERLREVERRPQIAKNFTLSDYFHFCLCAHWATAGTYVPTNVDNQIRESLWKHPDIKNHFEKMVKNTIDAWKWDYSSVTARKVHLGNGSSEAWLSTHEGTWLSVAIGACIFLWKHNLPRQQEVKEIILEEIKKEEIILNTLREEQNAVDFLKTSALMAHNFGDLDRVMDQWLLPSEHELRKQVYKLGHQLNNSYSSIFVFAGQVNKAFLAQENHRHMSLRQAKGLRKAPLFLVPIGPFMYDWGREIAQSSLLTISEKAEVLVSLFEGWKRQDWAQGYVRAFAGFMSYFSSPNEMFEYFIRNLAIDFIRDLQKSKFYAQALVPEAAFLENYFTEFRKFSCPLTHLNF